MKRLLVLRPEPGASATAERACGRGLDAVVISLFAIEAIEWVAPDPGGFDALLLTSANAVRFGWANPQHDFTTLEGFALGHMCLGAAILGLETFNSILLF